MALDEHARHHVHDWARQTWDEAAADSLMEMLPPVGWADVATKRDLDHLGTELRLEMQSLEHRLSGDMAHLEARLTQRMLTTMITGMGIQTAVIGTLLALTR